MQNKLENENAVNLKRNNSALRASFNKIQKYNNC